MLLNMSGEIYNSNLNITNYLTINFEYRYSMKKVLIVYYVSSDSLFIWNIKTISNIVAFCMKKVLHIQKVSESTIQKNSFLSLTDREMIGTIATNQILTIVSISQLLVKF